MLARAARGSPHRAPRHSVIAVDVRSPSPCPPAELLAAFAERTCDEAARDALEAHIDTCEACAACVAAWARAYGAQDEASIADPRAAVPLTPGSVVGRYRVTGVLGVGGMGIVYAARDPELERAVALKLVRARPDADAAPSAGASSDGPSQARLLEEARALARVSHPNVVAVHDVGMLGDEVYIAMELVAGETLGAWVRGARRSVGDILERYLQAGRALAAAHEAGLVHRDFKPDNALVGSDGRVRVVDFGLAAPVLAPRDEVQSDSEDPAGDLAPPSARAREPSRDSVTTGARLATRTGALVGTLRYMAPEQHRGERADAHSDQFAFSVALHEALFGAHPFGPGPASARRARVLAGEQEPLPRAHAVPRAVCRALARGLAPERRARFASMALFVRALEQGLVPVPERRMRRLALPFAIVAALGLALALVGFGVGGAPSGAGSNQAGETQEHAGARDPSAAHQPIGAGSDRRGAEGPVEPVAGAPTATVAAESGSGGAPELAPHGPAPGGGARGGAGRPSSAGNAPASARATAPASPSTNANTNTNANANTSPNTNTSTSTNMNTNTSPSAAGSEPNPLTDRL